MNTTFTLKTTLIAAALAVMPLAHAATMTKADYQADKIRITADYKADKATCGSLSGNANDICVEQAKGKEKLALAQLEYAHTGKPEDHNKVMKAKAEVDYAIAKEKCDDLAGNPKDVCVKEAQAAETKALADAKLDKKVGEAQTEAADDKRDAAYKVAAEKCDALAGDAKASCMSAAKLKFGKN
jgi:hypothetical protein